MISTWSFLFRCKQLWWKQYFLWISYWQTILAIFLKVSIWLGITKIDFQFPIHSKFHKMLASNITENLINCESPKQNAYLFSTCDCHPPSSLNQCIPGKGNTEEYLSLLGIFQLFSSLKDHLRLFQNIQCQVYRLKSWWVSEVLQKTR